MPANMISRMLKDLLETQKELLSFFFEHVDEVELESAANAMLQCPGNIVLSGVGKSGIVAEKIAMTFVSTGTVAQFLSAGNALHGDIGLVNEGDCVILLSRSGETEELLKLIPFIKARGAKVQAWVCKAGSTLGRLADHELILPMEKELCSYDLAPTTSAAIQMIVGDAIAVWLMDKRQFSLDEYQQNHPLGQIGKRIQLKVQDVMLIGERVPKCHPEDRLGDVLIELTNKRCGCVVVTDENESIVGIFTDGDLRRALQNQCDNMLDEPIANLMTRDFIAVKKEERAEIAKRKMQEKRRVMMLPVVEENALVGLLHMHDLIQSGI